MSDLLEQLLIALGRNVPADHSLRELMAEATATFDEERLTARLAEAIRVNRVILPAYRNAEVACSPGDCHLLSNLMSNLQPSYERRRRHLEEVIPFVREDIQRILHDSRIRFMFIKGAGLEKYPQGYLRQMNDLDLITETLDELFVAARILVERGHRHNLNDALFQEASWMNRYLLDGNGHAELVGHLSIQYKRGNSLTKLDLHSAPYGIGPLATITSDMWERARALNSVVPTVEDQLLLVVGHAVSEGYFLIKDFNDAFAILSRTESYFDWDYFYQCIVQSDLAFAANYLFERLARDYPGELVPEQVITKLRRERTLVRSTVISLSSSGDSPSRWGLRGIALPALQAAAVGEAKRSRVYGYRKALAYTGWELRHRLLQSSFGDHKLLQHLFAYSGSSLFPSPTRGQLVYLVPILEIVDLSKTASGNALHILNRTLRTPIELELRARKMGIKVKTMGDTVAFLSLDSADAVLTPVDLFAATRDGVFDDAKVSALEVIASLVFNDGEE